jgi:hypothetical protein
MNDINGPQQCRTPEGHGEVGDTSRAFAQGTGVLLQTVGGILFLSSCCVCSSAFLWDPQWSLIQAQSYQQQQIDGQPPISAHHITKPARFGLMLMVMFTTVGGLAMMVFGLGLQTEMPASGWSALVTNVVFLLVLITAGVALWWGQAPVSVRIWHGIVGVVVTCLLGFTITALRQMIAHPPSGDLHVVPANYDPRKDTGDG